MLAIAAPRLQLSHIGPIVEADVSFGDLTVLVGPQATGKSVFLQTLKLLVDRNHIHDTFGHHSMVFNGDSDGFLGAFYGKGMASVWKEASSLTWKGKAVTLPELARPTKSRQRDECLFFVPAQRVMAFASGVTQNFGQFNYGDPFTLRYFSHVLHELVQNEYGAKADLFPQPNRLNSDLRRPIEKHLFGGSKLVVDTSEFTKRLELKVPGHRQTLPYTAWSAGQREFTPLLLGLYWLCPGGANPRRQAVEWVVVEEPEMGLHPQGIAAVLLLVLELLRRGYRVVLSTHSTVVLDLVWALQEFKALGAEEQDVRQLFDLRANPTTRELSQVALQRDYRVYYFGRDRSVADISSLDPSGPDPGLQDWGGLAGFSNRTNAAIARAVNRAAAQPPIRKPRRSKAKA
jgi:energy-coupling factor transporter ATP-binding protein EcfA2